MTMLKRAPAPPRRPNTGGAFEPMLLSGGKVQPLSAVRSSYGQQLLTKLGNRYADWDDYALAEAYETGLTAYACITTRATILAQIPLRVETAQGDVLLESPASDFIARSREMLWWMTGCSLIFGKIYLKKCINRYGFPSLLDPINPIDVFPIVNYHKRVVEGYRISQTPGTVPRHDMVDIRNLSFTNDFGATSPLELAIRRIAAQESLAQWIASFFANSARIDGILSYEGGDVDEEEIPKMEARWKALFKGPVNAFKTFIAAASGGGKWNWIPIQNNMDELAMPETVKMLREDICAVLHCHPTLIGLAGASDALSANSTYKAVHDEHVQYVALPTLEYFCEQLNNQWLSVDFPLFGRLRIVPDLSKIQGDLLATGERATTASTNVTSGAWGINEARSFIGSQPVEGVVERNPEWSLRMYETGVLKRHQVLKATGVPIEPDVPDGFIYELDPRHQAAPGGIFGGMFGGGNNPTPPSPTAPDDPNRDALPDAPPPPPALPAIAGNPASLTLSLANNGDLIGLQNRLRQQFPDPGIRWLDPAEFHVTLIACPVIDDETLMAFYDYVSSLTLPAIVLRVGSLASFDSVGEHAIHFRIRRNEELLNLQAKLVKWLTANEVEVSSYHLPELFQPHVTMCYAPERTKVITFNGNLTVAPRHLCFSRRKGLEDWEDVYTLELAIPHRAHPHEKQLTELDRWRDKVRNRGDIRARFVTQTLSEQVTEWVVANLNEGWNPSEVFTRAKEWVRAEDDLPPELGAPPEEWAEYWSGFDDIPDSLAEEWLGYQAAIGDDIMRRALGDEPAQFDLPDLQSERERLVDAWVGTAEAPGPMLQFLLAGMAAGDRSLARTTRAEVSWEIALDDALRFARGYSFDLIRNIDDTTRAAIRDVMEKSVQGGWSKAQLEAELRKVVIAGGETPNDQILRRADLIAQTEGIRAFNEGAFQRWEIAGVTRAKWQTVNDGKVCPICRALHGSVTEFRSGWQIDGKVYKAIAHPGCRCFRRPVV